MNEEKKHQIVVDINEKLKKLKQELTQEQKEALEKQKIINQNENGRTT